MSTTPAFDPDALLARFRAQVAAAPASSGGGEIKQAIAALKQEAGVADPAVFQGRVLGVLDRIVDHLDRLEAAPAARARAGTRDLYDGPSEGEMNFDYAGFEAKFRGSFDTIKDLMRAYVPAFAGDRLVLDIGCGRGEMVELLKEAGVPVRGVDLNPESVAFGQARGLPLEVADGFDVLRAMPDNSLGGVFMAHVIEHIEAAQMLQLFELIYRKLAPGGVMITETPNPECLLIFASTFYMDLTHLRPVHPKTYEFVLKGIGFREVVINYNGSLEPLRVPPLEGTGISNLDAFNRAMERVNGLLFGYLDFVGLAVK